MLSRRRQCLLVFLSLSCAMAADLLHPLPPLHIVTSPSVPYGIYVGRSLSERPVRRGTLVCLRASSPLAPSTLRQGVESARLPALWTRVDLIKRVVALPQDVVDEDRGVLVNGRRIPMSRARRADSKGRPLPQPRYPVTLTDEVWLGSDIQDGFDSRYFGAVKLAALSCVAEPLWSL